MTSSIVLKGGRLIDGLGGPPLDNAAVIILGNHITAVGPSESVIIPDEAEVIDTTGSTIMPGLIDAHIHLLGIRSMNPFLFLGEPTQLRGMRMVMDAWKLLDRGFTTVRDCGNAANMSIYLKKTIEEGTVIGPRIFSCGAIICQTGGHGDIAHFLPVEWVIQRGIGRFADGVAECRKAAREQLRAGADFIKICTSGGVLSEKDPPTAVQYSMEEIQAMVEEAHNFEVKIASHALANRAIKNALLGGVDTIEHAFYLDEEAIEIMLEKNTHYIPTLTIIEAIINKGHEVGIPENSINKAKEHHEAHLTSFEKAWKAGVKIGCGTDYNGSPIAPMGDNAVELEIQVKAGRLPMDVIVSATRINAEALGLEHDLGTIQPGKLADLLVVNGDPLEDISVLRDKKNITRVFKDGIQVPRMNIS